MNVTFDGAPEVGTIDFGVGDGLEPARAVQIRPRPAFRRGAVTDRAVRRVKCLAGIHCFLRRQAGARQESDGQNACPNHPEHPTRNGRARLGVLHAQAARRFGMKLPSTLPGGVRGHKLGDRD